MQEIIANTPGAFNVRRVVPYSKTDTGISIGMEVPKYEGWLAIPLPHRPRVPSS